MLSPLFNQRLSATFSLVLALLPLLAAAHEGDDDDMDMGSDTAMVMASGHMVPYLHFTPGADTIWFEGWVPTSAGAVAGASVGLFLLAIVERWIASIRAGAEGFWRKRAQILQSRATTQAGARQDKKSYAPIQTRSSSSGSSDAHGPAHKPVPPPVPPFSQAVLLRAAPPFVWAHDVARGVLHAGQSALGFAFMLAVMTYNVAYILAIVIGLGVGETLFGRHISAAGVAH